MKVVTAKNVTVFIYLVQKRAIAFEIDGRLYPSVYLLWKYSTLILNFTTTLFVLTKIVNGADLMVPGIVRDPNGYGEFQEKHIASISTTNNIAPIAVGVTAITTHDLDSIDPKGKCVIIYHVHGDKLCSLEDMPVLPVPNLGPPMWLTSVQSSNDFPPLPGGDNITSDISPIDEVPETPLVESPTSKDPVDEVAEMDKILMDCFLTAIKYSKALQLPMLTSSFYKLVLMPVCPADKTLDIKKSSYKKVGQFLKQMEKVQKGLLDRLV